ncbi:phosphatidylserine/phosphatidylglycerophosphate/cardiolipin synthase family protein [bacterium]|nr:phosphatidylserine/phosphatidylglycerophosphate/cardiolipin synthase family protein [bacterium]
MIQFFFEGPLYYKSLRDDIMAATTSVDIEMYYFASDKTGWEFAELLKKKAQQNVKVRLLCDKLGCQSSSSDLFDDLKAGQVEVKFYNPPLTPQRPSWHRNHRKMMIIDKKIGFLGGFNIGSEYFIDDNGRAPWRDTGIKFDIPELVQEMFFYFGDVWNHNKLSLKNFWYKSKPPVWEKGPFHLASSKGWRRQNAIRAEYDRAIRTAKVNILITNPYFVPNRRLARLLRFVAASGVDVRILTAGISDIKLVKWASQSTYTRFLKSGVKIYEYQNRVLHAKSAVIDGTWFTVGTSNFDYLSLYKNLEINFFGQDASYGELLVNQFKIDLESAHEITLAQWKKRPWWQKLIEKFAYFFRKWM